LKFLPVAPESLCYGIKSTNPGVCNGKGQCISTDSYVIKNKIDVNVILDFQGFNVMVFLAME
jgi:hypothetical protein